MAWYFVELYGLDSQYHLLKARHFEALLLYLEGMESLAVSSHLSLAGFDEPPVNWDLRGNHMAHSTKRY